MPLPTLLQISALMSGVYGTLSCIIPITIGTVPLVSNLCLPVNDQPSTSTSCVSAEPPEYLNKGSISIHLNIMHIHN